MNREFKVWCKNKNEWEKHTTLIDQDGRLYQNISCPGCAFHLVELSLRTHIVYFYTGLKDKNGKKIFEGDVINTHYIGTDSPKSDFKAEIIWLQKELSWAFKNGLGWQRLDENMWPWIVNREIEVIGNIKDNPELLEA